jgi:hypothetical protein
MKFFYSSIDIIDLLPNTGVRRWKFSIVDRPREQQFRYATAFEGKANMTIALQMSAFDPKRTSGPISQSIEGGPGLGTGGCGGSPGGGACGRHDCASPLARVAQIPRKPLSVRCSLPNLLSLQTP